MVLLDLLVEAADFDGLNVLMDIMTYSANQADQGSAMEASCCHHDGGCCCDMRNSPREDEG